MPPHTWAAFCSTRPGSFHTSPGDHPAALCHRGLTGPHVQTRCPASGPDPTPPRPWGPDEPPQAEVPGPELPRPAGCFPPQPQACRAPKSWCFHVTQNVLPSALTLTTGAKPSPCEPAVPAARPRAAGTKVTEQGAVSSERKPQGRRVEPHPPGSGAQRAEAACWASHIRGQGVRLWRRLPGRRHQLLPRVRGLRTAPARPPLHHPHL